MLNAVILEGPDCGGKTTLSNRFTNFTRVHNGPYKSLHSRDLASIYSVSLAYTNPTVIDRAWLSETVYGNIIRNHDRLFPAYTRMLERLALSQNISTVICLPPIDIVVDQFAKGTREEYVSSTRLIEKIHSAYADYADRPRTRTLVYDYTGERLDAFSTFEGLYEALNYFSIRKNNGPGIGNWLPEAVTLLVGDRPNLNNNNGDPFVDFTHGNGCAVWLAKELENYGVPESRLYWINAKDVDNKTTDPSFIDDLRPIKVIAFGNEAYNWCAIHGISASKVPHPTFWKRFNTTTQYPLKELLC